MSNWRERNSNDVSYTSLYHRSKEVPKYSKEQPQTNSPKPIDYLRIWVGFLLLLSSVTISLSLIYTYLVRSRTDIIGNGSGNGGESTTEDIKFVKLPSSPPKYIIENSASQDLMDRKFQCYKEVSGNFTIVTSRMGSNERVLMRMTDGAEYFGDSYSATVRCQNIVKRMNHAISSGATGWKADMKNGHQIICASNGNANNSKCLKDESGPLVIATFKKGVNPTKMLTALSRINDVAVSSSPVPSF